MDQTQVRTKILRELYKPVQPTVKQSGEKVVYVEAMPDPLLSPFIYCYWQLRTTEPLSEPFHYRVVADGCIDIFFELNDPRDSHVMGFCKTFVEFPLENSFHYCGVRFLPTMFPQLFGVNAIELSNRYELLSAVVPGLSHFLADRFHGQLTWDQTTALLDQYFLQHVATIRFNDDPRLYHALEIILRNQGVIDVETDLDTGISARQLRRLFEFYVGDTAKTFSKVVRFQNILKAKPSRQSLRQNKLFLDGGYFDQSHFIKEFKNFYGVTPSRAFGR